VSAKGTVPAGPSIPAVRYTLAVSCYFGLAAIQHPNAILAIAIKRCCTDSVSFKQCDFLPCAHVHSVYTGRSRRYTIYRYKYILAGGIGFPMGHRQWLKLKGGSEVFQSLNIHIDILCGALNRRKIQFIA